MNDKIISFLILWLTVIFFNQVFFFGACFKGYCLINAIPRTFIITAVIMILISNQEKNQS